MKVKVKVPVTKLCLTLFDPMDSSLTGSSVHGILQTMILKWVAILFSNNIYRENQEAPLYEHRIGHTG